MSLLRKGSRLVLHSAVYRTLIFLAIIFSIFSFDLIKGWMPASYDRLLNIVMTASFLLLVSEQILTIVVYKHWWKQGSFWLFSFATLTMLFDMDWFLSLFVLDSADMISFLPIRFLRLIRLISRMGRMIRILRVFVTDQMQTLKARLTGSGADRGDHLMAHKIMSRLTGQERSAIWKKIESVISLGVMWCFLVLYLILTGYLNDQLDILPSAYSSGEFLLSTGAPAAQADRLLEGNPEILYYRSGSRTFRDERDRLQELRSSEVLSYKGEDGELVVDNSFRIREFHRTSFSLTMILFGAMLFITLYVNWVIQKYSLEFSGVLKTLARALDERDAYTREHSRHVSVYARALAAAMGLKKREQEVVQLAGELHDIGKIGVPEGVLHKNGPLNDDEYDVMKRHPVQGIEIMDHIVNLDQVVLAAYYHHEKYNGKGYPEGLEGDSIPRIARILSVCDVWDALTTDRPYRPSMPFEKASSIMKKMRGEDLPPDEVDAFFDHEVWNALNR